MAVQVRDCKVHLPHHRPRVGTRSESLSRLSTAPWAWHGRRRPDQLAQWTHRLVAELEFLAQSSDPQHELSPGEAPTGKVNFTQARP